MSAETKHLILAHDLGTTGNKALLYEAGGRALASVFHAYPTAYPKTNWAMQNPEDWWSAVCITTRKLIDSAHIDPVEIACVVFSGQMMGCVPVDWSVNPLCDAIIWADQRAVEEARLLTEKIGFERVYQITGHRPSPAYTAAKILWIRRHQPEIFNRAHKFLLAKDFIIARLTGKFVTDYSDASGMNLYDLQQKAWSEEILAGLELEARLLPELHASVDVIGGVTHQSAAATGLMAGTPVVAGGGDGACATVGAGVVKPGSAYNYIGSSSWIGITTQQPILDPEMRTFTFAHLIPGWYNPIGTMQSAGGAYQWTRDIFCAVEKNAAAQMGVSTYELMNLQAEHSSPGAQGLIFLPYLLGERSPRWNPHARGAFIGLTMKHTRQDMIRAVLEGITLNLRVILEAFQRQGANLEAMRVIGGGAQSPLWRQIMADIYGIPVQRPNLLEEATSLGAAIAGGVGVGLYPDFSIAETLTPIVDSVEPNVNLKELYEELYQVFNKSYEALVDVYTDMSRLNL